MKNYANKLHIGCGQNTPEGWVNLDASWNAWMAKYPLMRRFLKILQLIPADVADIPWNKNVVIHDVQKPLPFAPDYFKAVYASHLLEHLYLEKAKALLRECFRVLEPGGVLRVVVPDLRTIILEYISGKPFGKISPELEPLGPADRLNRRLLLRNPEPPSGNVIYKVYTVLKDFHSHKWNYDADSLCDYFKLAGFVQVEELQFRQSRIKEIEEIEDPGRVLDGAGIVVEGIKPSTD